MSCHCEGQSHGAGCDEYPAPVASPYKPRPLECRWPRQGRPCYLGSKCLACSAKYGPEACSKAEPMSDAEQKEWERAMNGKLKRAGLLFDGDDRNWADFRE